MSTAKMHADEVATDSSLVRRLLAAQFPQWAELPIEPFPSAGTVNAVYRLGASMAVRLPRVVGGVEDVEREQKWLPRLGPLLPVAIPEVLGHGRPGEGYPWPWSVYSWLEGENPTEGRLTVPGGMAHDLADFIADLHAIDPTGAPPAYRGGPMAERDAGTRSALAKLHDLIDTEAATAVWDAALRVPEWPGPDVWVHSDLMPANLLVEEGRLSGVIDFGTVGAGDPACDLIPAWNLLPADARETFREALHVDEGTWARGRGRALSMALIQLPYYQHTNPVMAANARHVIKEVLAD